jgi:DNA repair protein RadC
MENNRDIYKMIKQLFNTGEILMDQTMDLIEKSGGLGRLLRYSESDLNKICNLPINKIRRIKTALDLGKLALTENQTGKNPLINSSDVYNYILPQIGWPEEEEFWLIGLDVRQKPIFTKLIAKGSQDHVEVSLGSLFKYLLRYSAPRGICIHTHPSGDPSPSETDIQLTDKIIEISVWLGIAIVDHLILGQGNYCSLADKGYF